MDRNSFILANSMLRVLEKKLFSEEKLLKILELSSMDEILKNLKEANYSRIDNNFNINNYEEILFFELCDNFLKLKEILKENSLILDIIALKYEYQNLKLKLKKEKLIENLDKYIFETSVKEKELLELNYKKAIKEKDLKKATILLDKLYLEHIFILANKLNLDMLKEYVKIMIDKYNLVTFLRLKNQNQNIDNIFDVFVENGSFKVEDLLKKYTENTYYLDFKKVLNLRYFSKDEDIFILEKEMDNKIIELAKKYKNINIGPEPIISYLIFKEFEINSLRLIISAKINDIDIELVKTRMRGIYV